MIDKIDYDKYIVIKKDDLKFLTNEESDLLKDIRIKIDVSRSIRENKPLNNYLVLNIDDNFDNQYLWNKLTDIGINQKTKIKDIAIHLVNSILKLQS